MVQAEKQDLRKKRIFSTIVVQTLKIDGVYYIQRLVPCNNRRCKTCPHGPYWYCRVQRHGKMREIYIGKVFKTLAQVNEERMEKEKERNYGKNTRRTG